MIDNIIEMEKTSVHLLKCSNKDLMMMKARNLTKVLFYYIINFLHSDNNPYNITCYIMFTIKVALTSIKSFSFPTETMFDAKV